MAYSLALNMNTACSSKTLLNLYLTTQCYITEGSTVNRKIFSVHIIVSIPILPAIYLRKNVPVGNDIAIKPDCQDNTLCAECFSDYRKKIKEIKCAYFFYKYQKSKNLSLGIASKL